MPAFVRIFSAAAAITLSGCAPQPPELNIERQWAQAIARQAMWAFFPLDEDVMVGDVFIQFRDERRGELADGFNIVRVARTPALDVVQGLCESGAQRVPVADPPPKSGPQSPPSDTLDCGSVAAAWAKRQPGGAGVLPAGLRIGDGSGTGGLRRDLVVLPSVTVARLTQAQLGGSSVLGNFAANIGLGGGSTIALSIELRGLQQLQIENEVAWGMLIALVPGDSAARPLSILRLLGHRAPAELDRVCRGGKPQPGSAQVSIATRVLYASGVTYNFAQSDQFVARLALDATAAVIPNQQQPGQTPSLGTSSAVAGAPSNFETLRAQLEALSGALAGGPTGAAAGGNARLVIGTLGTSALNVDFARPLAVGAGSRLVFPLEEALLPRDANEVGEVMRYCWQVAGTLQFVGTNQKASPKWCEEVNERLAWPTGWTGGSDALYERLCKFVAARDKFKKNWPANGARSFRDLGGNPLSSFFSPGLEPFVGVSRGS